MKSYLLLVGMALALTACDAPSSSNQASGANAPAAEGKGEISKSRSAAFKSFMPTFSSMGKVVKGDEAFEPEAFKAKAAQFTKEAREPFEYFQNDPQGNGDALPVVWEKANDFKAQQDKFLASVDKLNEVAQTGKLDDIKVAYGDVGANCKACHDTFRRPK